ncbi:unnamed protein product [Ectocarpus sp. 12 AP-2014]
MDDAGRRPQGTRPTQSGAWFKTYLRIPERTRLPVLDAYGEVPSSFGRTKLYRERPMFVLPSPVQAVRLCAAGCHTMYVETFFPAREYTSGGARVHKSATNGQGGTWAR